MILEAAFTLLPLSFPIPLHPMVCVISCCMIRMRIHYLCPDNILWAVRPVLETPNEVYKSNLIAGHNNCVNQTPIFFELYHNWTWCHIVL